MFENNISQISDWLYSSLKRNRNVLFGISILYVILYHSGFAPLFGRGYIGVDIFLFLSAFGLCFSLQKNSILRFYLRRLNRIYPLFVISNLFKWGIERFQGVRIGLWDTFCDITGLTFFGIGGTHLLWFIPSLMILYIFTPLLYNVFSLYKNKAFYIMSFVSFALMMIFKNMDWHYGCFVSRIPIFSLGLLYYIHGGVLKKLSMPLLFCVFLHELTVSNDLKFASATFYAPVLLLVLCYVCDKLLRLKVVNMIAWVGSKSLECFIGNGIVTSFMNYTGVHKYVYYFFANIIWIFIFIIINKFLPSNKKTIKS